jgi:hypothetical protein
MRMRWCRAQKLFALLGAVWFILVRIEPTVFGACPAHVMAPTPASHGSHAVASMPMDAAATHHSAAAGDADGTPAEHHSHQCTCPGSCCGASVLATPYAAARLQIVVVVAQTPRLTGNQYRASWTDFVLPFATAPPQPSLA